MISHQYPLTGFIQCLDTIRFLEHIVFVFSPASFACYFYPIEKISLSNSQIAEKYRASHDALLRFDIFFSPITYCVYAKLQDEVGKKDVFQHSDTLINYYIKENEALWRIFCCCVQCFLLQLLQQKHTCTHIYTK